VPVCSRTVNEGMDYFTQLISGITTKTIHGPTDKEQSHSGSIQKVEKTATKTKETSTSTTPSVTAIHNATGSAKKVPSPRSKFRK